MDYQGSNGDPLRALSHRTQLAPELASDGIEKDRSLAPLPI